MKLELDLINLHIKTLHNLIWMNSRYFFIILVIFLSSCSKEFLNPYDPATPPDIWMPKSFNLVTLGTNTVGLTWQQDEQHIDGFVVQKNTNGVLKEFLLLNYFIHSCNR